MSENTNISPGPRSRRPPKSGDGFTIEVAGVGYLLGKVVSTEAIWSIGGISSGTANLIYLYKGTYPTVDAATAGQPNELLSAPLLTNNLPWSRGYFQPLPKGSTVQYPPAAVRHCFRFIPTNSYYDERGQLLDAPFDPVGEFGLHSYRTIDDLISDAIGIPRAE